MELPIATLLIGALILDRLVGDPNVSWHPVVLIGRYISFVESWLLKEQDSVARKRVNGLLLLIVDLNPLYKIIGSLPFKVGSAIKIGSLLSK